jgi:hypothetical protein
LREGEGEREKDKERKKERQIDRITYFTSIFCYYLLLMS